MHDARQIRPWLVSVFVLRHEGGGTKVLLMKRVAKPAGIWCQVAGKIEAGEKAYEAALRELREETELVPTQFFSADICEQFYEPGKDEIVIAPVFVAWVNPNDQVVMNEEHSEYAWLDASEAADRLCFANQRNVMRHIAELFIDGEPNPLLELPVTA